MASLRIFFLQKKRCHFINNCVIHRTPVCTMLHRFVMPQLRTVVQHVPLSEQQHFRTMHRELVTEKFFTYYVVTCSVDIKQCANLGSYYFTLCSLFDSPKHSVFVPCTRRLDCDQFSLCLWARFLQKGFSDTGDTEPGMCLCSVLFQNSLAVILQQTRSFFSTPSLQIALYLEKLGTSFRLFQCETIPHLSYSPLEDQVKFIYTAYRQNQNNPVDFCIGFLWKIGLVFQADRLYKQNRRIVCSEVGACHKIMVTNPTDGLKQSQL